MGPISRTPPRAAPLKGAARKVAHAPRTACAKVQMNLAACAQRLNSYKYRAYKPQKIEEEGTRAGCPKAIYDKYSGGARHASGRKQREHAVNK